MLYTTRGGIFFFNENIVKKSHVSETGTGCCKGTRTDIPSATAKIVINDDVVLCHLW